MKTGQGSLVLAANNSSFGISTPTTIVVNDGSLVVANENGLGGANVQLNQGSLASLTNATLTGTLQVTSGTSISTLQGATLVIASQIGSIDTGDGCFEKNGVGTLIMTGAAAIAPGTCVQEGRLYANGQLSSNVTVKSDGILRGTGLIHGNANVMGRLAPGNSPGTLQVAGTVTMAAGSTYQEDINGTGVGSGPGRYSRLIVSGAGNQFVATGATLEPNLVNITGTDTYIPYVPKVGDLFRIVTAEGGIAGTFAAVEQPVGLEANTRIETYYGVGGHSIDLVIVPTSYQTYVADHAGNVNAQSAAGAIDSLAEVKQAGTSTVAQDALLYTLGTSGNIAGRQHRARGRSARRDGGRGAAGDPLAGGIRRPAAQPGLPAVGRHRSVGRHRCEPQRLARRRRGLRLRHHALAGGGRLGAAVDRVRPARHRLHARHGGREERDRPGLGLDHAGHRLRVRRVPCGPRRARRPRLVRQQRLGNLAPRPARRVPRR